MTVRHGSCFSGVNLRTDKIVRQDKDLKEPLKPFKGQIVYLQGKKSFKETWSKLVEAGGGEAIKAWFRSKYSSLRMYWANYP